MGRHDRLAALSQLDRDGLVLADLGCGDGRTVRAMLRHDPAPAVAHAVDAAMTLDDDLLHDERVRSRVADLEEPLPFEDASIDRIVSLNVVESIADPVALLTECARVLRPGGLAVIAHSDFDTALFSSSDDALTRQLVDRFVAEVPRQQQRADGFMGRKLLGLALDCPLELVDVHSWADPHRRFDQGSLAWKIAMGVLAAARDDEDLSARASLWVEDLHREAAEGRFLFAVIDVAVVLRKP